MRSCCAALLLASVFLCTAVGQQAKPNEVKPIEVKPGERYHVEWLSVTKDKQRINDWDNNKIDVVKMLQIREEQFERLKSGTLLEIIRIEPRSADFPVGYVECKRTNFRGPPETVYALPSHLRPDSVRLTQASQPDPPLAPGQPFYRSWKSADGSFEVSAELLEYDAMKVVLKREKDGKELQLTPDKLSAADRQWLADLASLEGVWLCVSIEHMGMVMPDPRPEWLAIFHRGRFGLMYGANLNVHGELALNSKANPKTLDIINPISKQKVLGIYQVDKDSLKLALAAQEKDPRPAALKGAKAGTMIFKREKN
ncbi:TIGR03067 domain-containing protein [Anatilimnocola floriformis]|uniref:TIGR03067 domain-containing protein n=1 Tax=Anatilimnocola floriformis TaxID=2948575 RepID=UPI0020C2DC47|nr:TIGR03067 domain-containing protein [Anatilimnocola floriformis]